MAENDRMRFWLIKAHNQTMADWTRGLKTNLGSIRKRNGCYVFELVMLKWNKKERTYVL